MKSREDWISDIREQFPDAREDVLGFIYDFNSRSNDLYDVFASGYCYYFAEMLNVAFNTGEVCWSAGRGHVVWVDENDIAYDISGVYHGFDQLIPIGYLGELVNNFKHIRWEYQCDEVSEWCRTNQVSPIQAVVCLWQCIPSSKLNYEGTVEQDVLKHWNKYVDQIITYKGAVYCVETLAERLPSSIRRCYANDRECVLANLDSLLD